MSGQFGGDSRSFFENDEFKSQLRDFLVGFFKDSYQFPREYKNWLQDYIAINIPDIPVSQVQGYSNATPNPASTIATSETTASTTYTALTTAGPSLTGLSQGKYLFIFGCVGATSADGRSALMNIAFNGNNPADDDDAVWISSNPADHLASGVSWVTKTFTTDNNSAVAVYRSTNAAATGTFSRRRLVGIRLSNA